MQKWVCVYDKWSCFTYGKVYEGEVEGSILNVPNDLGEYVRPSLWRYEVVIKNYKFSTRYFGLPQEKVPYFITLEEWREQKIDDILKYEV